MSARGESGGSVKEDLEGASTLLEVAARLGSACLPRAGRLRRIKDDEVAGRDVLMELETAIASLGDTAWSELGPRGDFTDLLERPDVASSLAVAESRGEVAHLGVLRGIVGPLRRFYDDVEARVPLAAGMPVPFATREVNGRFHATPRLQTIGRGDLLADLGFYLFDPGLDGSVEVVLDFRHRHALDKLTWQGRTALPRIATIHPHLGEDGFSDPEDFDESSFFGVRPRWNLDAIVAQLASVSERAEIAVLPELSLPSADALQSVLEEDPTRYPPLVVAGSAHVRERNENGEDVRANESRVYLEGELVATHRKIHPFVLKRIGATDLPQPMAEGITGEPKALTILAGECTRLAVAICADLNDDTIPILLEKAGINLLLIPSMTDDPGAFNDGICQLASRCQAVAVVVNGDGSAIGCKDPDLFLVMAAVPRGRSAQQSREYAAPSSGLPAVGLFDPNIPLPDELDWQ